MFNRFKSYCQRRNLVSRSIHVLGPMLAMQVYCIHVEKRTNSMNTVYVVWKEENHHSLIAKSN